MKTICARWHYAGLVGILAILILVLLVGVVRWATPQATMSFVSLAVTSVAEDGLSALITISNKSAWQIGYRTGSPQIKGIVLWPAPEFTEGPMLGLGPHESASFTVSAPINGSAWRVPVLCGRRRSPAEFYLRKAEQQISRWTGRDPASLSYLAQTNVTPEINR